MPKPSLWPVKAEAKSCLNFGLVQFGSEEEEEDYWHPYDKCDCTRWKFANLYLFMKCEC